MTDYILTAVPIIAATTTTTINRQGFFNLKKSSGRQIPGSFRVVFLWVFYSLLNNEHIFQTISSTLNAPRSWNASLI